MATTGSSTTTTRITEIRLFPSRTRTSAEMIYLTDIIDAYKVARCNKRRTSDQTDFELHWERECVNLLHQVREKALRPTAYTFVTLKPKPREVFASDMATRVMHHYLDIRLRPLLEKRLSEHTYNNRTGKGQKACQNAVISDIYEMSEGLTGNDTYIIKLDLKACFPNIKQDIAYQQLREVIEQDYHGRDKDELLYILQSCVFSNPTGHCRQLSSGELRALIPGGKSLFCKPEGTGAAIGFLIWQNAVNYYFHEIDEWLSGIEGIRFERFVDDIYIITNNKEVTLTLIPELRARLSSLGAELNESKFYCQHYTKGVECLGLHIKKGRIHLNARTINKAIRKAKSLPRACDENVDKVLSSLNSYGGMIRQTNGHKQIERLYQALSEGWKKMLRIDENLCFKAENTHRKRIIKKYNLLKINEYGNKRADCAA